MTRNGNSIQRIHSEKFLKYKSIWRMNPLGHIFMSFVMYYDLCNPVMQDM